LPEAFVNRRKEDPGSNRDRRAHAVRDATLHLVLMTIRGAGKALPAWALLPLLWPIAWLRALHELGWGRPLAREYRPLAGPPLLPPGAILGRGRLLLGRARLNTTKLMVLWPEKLASARRFVCRVEGADRLAAIRAGDRPTLLVTLHFGPSSLFFQWLRARGCPVASVGSQALRDLPWYRRHLARLRDSRAGLTDVPSVIKLGQVWEMHDHLAACRPLMAAIDGGQGRHRGTAVVQGLALTISTGSFRLAALTEALAVPCLARSGPRGSMTVWFGEPVPANLVADPARHEAACAHLFREALPVLAAAPEECSYELLAALRRTGVGEGVLVPAHRPSSAAARPQP
jgi:lauroyl/myristoyl acyltransferase